MTVDVIVCLQSGEPVGEMQQFIMRPSQLPQAFDRVVLPGLSATWSLPDGHSLMVADVTREYEPEDDELVLARAHLVLEAVPD